MIEAPGQPVLDVMIPAYGDDPLLREAVRSVLAQTDPRWRLTVLDDGVEEGRTGELAAWLGSLDPRVRYLPNPVRLGINRNFQRCVDEARADWLVLLGADDRLLPHFVGRCAELIAAHPAAAWLHTGATIIDGAGDPVLPLVDRVKFATRPRIDGVRVMDGEDLASSLLHGNWMNFPSCLFRRAAVAAEGFREGYDIVLDLDLYLRLLLAGGSAVLLAEPCIEYRRHAGSLSSAGATDGTRFAEEVGYFTETADVLEAHGWQRAARAARWHWTSRAHGVAKLPGLVGAGEFAVARRILGLALATRHEPVRSTHP